MKRLLLFIIIAVFLSSCTVKNVQIENLDSNVEKTINKSKISNTVFIVDSINDIDFANKMNIDDIIISTYGVRIDDKNYRTDYKSLKNLDTLIRFAKSKEMNFYIEVTSGPGYNKDKGNFGIFKKDSQKYYFAQMLNEIAKRYNNMKGFKGLSIKIETADKKLYYETVDYIYRKVKDSELIYNINVSDFNSKALLNSDYINAINLNFNSLKYPGYSMLNNSNLEINRNILLNMLQKYKKNNLSVIIVINAQWSDEHNAFLQDLFEISRILNFDIAIDNTSAIHKSQKLIKIIRKMNDIHLTS